LSGSVWCFSGFFYLIWSTCTLSLDRILHDVARVEARIYVIQ
jgi:hypothetical protein